MRSPAIETSNPLFTPPFLGYKHLKGIPINEIADFLNETALYRMQWGYRPDKSLSETDTDFRLRCRKYLNKWLNKAKIKNLLIPIVSYGYFYANSDDNNLIIWADENKKDMLETFTFPRQKEKDRLCIADFFRPIDSNELDSVAFSVVSIGDKISEKTACLFKENSYSDYLHLHGLGVEMAEALAEYFHKRIREEWGFGDEDAESLGALFRQKYRGGRYSWGYPACPDLEDNVKVAKLLAVDKLGIEVSEETSWQFHPEQTTSAIICHHPKAKYFNTP